MKIVLFGANGNIGQRIVREALNRRFEVTAVVRDANNWTEQHDNLRVVEGDIMNPASVASISEGHEAVVSAYGPSFGEEEALLKAARSLVEGVQRAGVTRLLVVGGAGSLEVSPGLQLMDTPDFPEEYRPLAVAHAEALHIYSESDLDWTYLSPAATIESGRRTGQFRIGTDKLVLDELDRSYISIQDFAAAMIDEVEDPYFTRARFTVAY